MDGIDVAISAILQKIIGKWQKNISEDDLKETVVISSPRYNQLIISPLETIEDKSPDKNILIETVVLERISDAACSSQQAQSVESSHDDSLAETVILGHISNTSRLSQKPQSAESSREDSLAETVILGRVNESAYPSLQLQSKGREEDLSSTLLIHPTAKDHMPPKGIHRAQKRIAKRIPKRMEAKVKAMLMTDNGLDLWEHTGFTDNLSLGGLFVCVTKILPPKTLVDITLLNEGPPIVLAGEVCRNEVQPRKGMGIRLIKTSDRYNTMVTNA